jgi:hypothetical protein
MLDYCQCVTKIAVFLDVMACSVIETYQNFVGTCCLHFQINSDWNKCHHIPEDSDCHCHQHENLISHISLCDCVYVSVAIL